MKAPITKFYEGLGHVLALAFALLTTATIRAQTSANEPTVVRIDSGTIRGMAGNGVLAFKGIPVA